MDRLLGLLIGTYVIYGLGFAVGLKGDQEDVNILGFLVVIAFWPFFKGLNDGDLT
jgi:hypothetical protein